jgi:LPXTG-site transpeptidase (sortase) family protein
MLVRHLQRFSEVVHDRVSMHAGFHSPKLPSSSRLLRILPGVLMMIGTALLLYVGSQYWTMYSQQRELAHEWERQQQLELVRGNGDPSTVVSDHLTRISVPKINLNAIVVEGTSQKALLSGPGHLTDTPAPGENGNSVISGHRDTFFRHIYELKTGDLVDVQRDGHSYVYEVTGKKIVDPTDLSVLKQTDVPTLTLITCYPTYYIGPAPERLVVFTKLAEKPQPKLSAVSTHTQLPKPEPAEHKKF